MGMIGTDSCNPTESLTERCERLGISLKHTSEGRKSRLVRATEIGADDATFVRLHGASRVGSAKSVTLAPGRYDHCSRGKGWARLGSGYDAQWGEATDGGYLVTQTGSWVVGSSDGFSRKDQRTDKVSLVQVGTAKWFIAE